MRGLRAHIGGWLVQGERRAIQLSGLMVLGIALVLGSIWPYTGGPRSSAADVAASRSAAPRPPAPGRPTAPSGVDREAAAVARISKMGVAVRSGGGRRRLVALTFDDGPGPYTNAVLKVLRREHTPATFFQVGRELHDFSDAAGNEARVPDVVVGDHTVNHAALDKLDRAGQEQEIDGAATDIQAAGERRPVLFRPPYGLWDDTTIDILRRRGMAMILWNVESNDYERPGVPVVISNVLNHVKPGAIVLMHDAGGDRSQTVAALPSIIHRLRKRGYGLVTVPRLLADDPPMADDRATPGSTPEGESGAG